MAKTIILLLGIGILSGCANSYQANDPKAPATKISANSKFYVMQPKDGDYGNTHYAGSGRMTSAAVAAELSKRGSEVVIAETAETIEAARIKANTRPVAKVCGIHKDSVVQ